MVRLVSPSITSVNNSGKSTMSKPFIRRFSGRAKPKTYICQATSLQAETKSVALRTGSAEATQSLFPLIFVFTFVSSAFFPTALMKGWYQSVAEANPFTFIVDPTRRLVIAGWSWSDVGQAVGFSLILVVASMSIAYRAHLGRLRRS